MFVFPLVFTTIPLQDVMNVALDAWGSPAQGLDGWEAASKAVVRTAQAQGPDRDSLSCMAVQCWWQEKPLQRRFGEIGFLERRMFKDIEKTYAFTLEISHISLSGGNAEELWPLLTATLS